MVPKPHRNTLHPTQKPVELITMMLANSTELGAVVYDPFAGSGTTLIAAAQIERIAVLVELDPGYVDTIVDRWQEWSGEQAERIEQ
jgi:DNA modification methylase